MSEDDGITAEQKFRRGQRVRPTADCPISRKRKSDPTFGGTVQGFGIENKFLVTIKFETAKVAVTYHMRFWEPIGLEGLGTEE
jgi:hypothetical protein